MANSFRLLKLPQYPTYLIAKWKTQEEEKRKSKKTYTDKRIERLIVGEKEQIEINQLASLDKTQMRFV